MSEVKFNDKFPPIFICSAEEAFQYKADAYFNVAEELEICDRIDAYGYKFGLRDDDETEDITRILPEILPLMQKHSSKGDLICVHCLEGVSRSVAVVVAFISFTQNISIQDSYELVKKQHPRSNIFPKYLHALLALFSKK